MDYISIFFEVGFWVATIRIATSLIFGTLGELVCERAGVLNLGIEGIMTLGAMSGWMWVYLGGSLWGAVFFVAFLGAMAGLIHSCFTVYLGLSQHVTGIALTMFASSLSYFAFRMMLPDVTTPPKIEAFSNYPVPLLSDIPFVGEVLFMQSPLTYLSLLMVALVIYIMYKTPFGLAMRMVGENPIAAEAQGINVHLVRTLSVMMGSSLMAIGGAFLTISAFDAFFFGMINGRGWICVALVIFASWQPKKALFGALLFAGIDAYQVRLQQVPGIDIPYQFFLMAPYILSIIALTLLARKAVYPKALLIPFRRGERH